MKTAIYNRKYLWLFLLLIEAQAKKKKKISDRDVDDEEGVEEFIDADPRTVPDPDRQKAPKEEPDSMGRSEEAKKQSSSETDRYKHRKKSN
ncbi:hypothetical protein [Negadavirga shengliensis]|uniref:Secreted protein n=1 Tax=Negadavirga shengliensis TaxID=1389218 RepID=A0ABV9SX30_9BACT